MKKDIEWLKREVLDHKFRGHTIHIDVLFELMDELDEPEVLSQEWVDENVVEGDFRGEQEFWYGRFVEEEKVRNLLVPKQEVTEEQAWNKIAEYYPDDIARLQSILEYFYYGIMARKVGDTYQPVVHILKVKNDKPTVIKVSGEEYVLRHTDQYRGGKS